MQAYLWLHSIRAPVLWHPPLPWPSSGKTKLREDWGPHPSLYTVRPQASFSSSGMGSGSLYPTRRDEEQLEKPSCSQDCPTPWPRHLGKCIPLRSPVTGSEEDMNLDHFVFLANMWAGVLKQPAETKFQYFINTSGWGSEQGVSCWRLNSGLTLYFGRNKVNDLERNVKYTSPVT